MRLGKRTLSVGAGAALLAIAALSQSAGATDPRVGQCGVTHADKVLQVLALDRASDFAAHFPLAPQLPELEDDARPAFVAIFAGHVEIASTGTAQLGAQVSVAAPIYSNAVCVLVGSEINVYPDLDITGAQP